MSRGFNQWIGHGGLTKDPELKHGQSGTAWCLFTLACGYSVKNGSGEWEDKADYIPCKVFGKTAENVCKYLRKGSPVMVVGVVKVDNYETNGEKKSFTYILAQDIKFPPKLKDGGDEGYQPSEHERSKSNGYAPQSKDVWDFGSDPGFKDTDEFPLDFEHGEEVNIPF